MLVLRVLTILFLCCLYLSLSVLAVDIYSDPHNFCYNIDNVCSPKSAEHWPGSCQGAAYQSPIDLVMPTDAGSTVTSTSDSVEVPLHHLKTDHFFMQNNGHTINIDFPNENELGDSYFFPGYGLNNQVYRLSNVHFHWGANDSIGSEHTVGGKAYSMEMHLVHYNAEYLSPVQAVGSGDKNALAVVGIFLEVGKDENPHPSLAPIVANLAKIHEVHSYWIKVEEILNLTPLIPKPGSKVFSYQGSLTTPGCNEQVNWFVFKEPLKIASSDVKAFRSVVDGAFLKIMENHRPIQPTLNRNVTMRTSTSGGSSSGGGGGGGGVEMSEKSGKQENIKYFRQRPHKMIKPRKLQTIPIWVPHSKYRK